MASIDDRRTVRRENQRLPEEHQPHLRPGHGEFGMLFHFLLLFYFWPEHRCKVNLCVTSRALVQLPVPSVKWVIQGRERRIWRILKDE
jgi:hypothetical protein